MQCQHHLYVVPGALRLPPGSFGSADPSPGCFLWKKRFQQCCKQKHRTHSATLLTNTRLADHIVELDGNEDWNAQQDYPAQLRRVRFNDPETGKTLTLCLTENLGSSGFSYGRKTRLPEGKVLSEAEFAAIPYELGWLERLA